MAEEVYVQQENPLLLLFNLAIHFKTAHFFVNSLIEVIAGYFIDENFERGLLECWCYCLRIKNTQEKGNDVIVTIIAK
eukprot:XP_001704749.1 Hypothetical protein GL50803_92888 [Giardia lamblia ATCC 50803]